MPGHNVRRNGPICIWALRAPASTWDASQPFIRSCPQSLDAYRPELGAYRGTSLIRRGHSENGRWHVLISKNVLAKRSVHVFKK